MESLHDKRFTLLQQNNGSRPPSGDPLLAPLRLYPPHVGRQNSGKNTLGRSLQHAESGRGRRCTVFPSSSLTLEDKTAGGKHWDAVYNMRNRVAGEEDGTPLL